MLVFLCILGVAFIAALFKYLTVRLVVSGTSPDARAEILRALAKLFRWW